MTLKSNFELMADYNQWINKSVYLAASKLDADETYLRIEERFLGQSSARLITFSLETQYGLSDFLITHQD